MKRQRIADATQRTDNYVLNDLIESQSRSPYGCPDRNIDPKVNRYSYLRRFFFYIINNGFLFLNDLNFRTPTGVEFSHRCSKLNNNNPLSRFVFLCFSSANSNPSLNSRWQTACYRTTDAPHSREDINKFKFSNDLNGKLKIKKIQDLSWKNLS